VKRYAIVILTLTGSLLLADDPRQAAIQKELDKLQGEWELVSAERDGKTIPPEQFKNERVTCNGDQMTVTKGGKVLQRSHLVLDPTATPRTFVRDITEGVNKGAKHHGIYEVEGDTFKECRVNADKERPREFSSKNGAFLGTYRRAQLREPRNEEPVPSDGEWVALFNGKNLDGWTIYPEGTTGWEVKDGVLVSSGPVSQLFSTRSDYKNFHFRVEAMINDGGRSAQGFRAKFGPGTPEGYKVAINSTSQELSGLRTGSLYFLRISTNYPLESFRDTLVRPDTWFTQEVIAEGNRFRVLIDGKEIVDCLDKDKTYTRGFFAFERPDRNTILKVRKIEVKELPPLRPVVQAGAEKGWTPLFNGKDLSGWKSHPMGTTGWGVKDGVLVSSGPVSQLFSTRGDYENFHFRVEARINHGGLSGQGFRAKFGPGTPEGYKAAINSTSRELTGLRTGSLYFLRISTNYPLESFRDILVKPDTWFTQEIIAEGNHITVKLDGEALVDLIDKDNSYRKGHLTLERADRDTVVQFRKIEIKELPLK
jgi:uncharacterized protein (TIGR03067 family)